ncbi:MAG TPA: carboxypeptidase [Clostridia bacterium]|nr:carboxypeptidase [Clostridia bacterium]
MKDQYGFDRMRIGKAEVIQVIRVSIVVGEGTPKDLCRDATQYYSLDGELLAASDPHGKGENVLRR